MTTKTVTKPQDTTIVEDTNQVSFNKVKEKEMMCFPTWALVKKIDGPGERILVEDLNTGLEIVVKGKDLIEKGLSADQFDREEKVTMTDCAKKLISSFNVPFTVCFDKQEDKTGKTEERVLRGKFVAQEDLLGRSHVVDLDIPKGKHRLRLVDHRTIKWLIVGGVKYVVNKK